MASHDVSRMEGHRRVQGQLQAAVEARLLALSEISRYAEEERVARVKRERAQQTVEQMAELEDILRAEMGALSMAIQSGTDVYQYGDRESTVGTHLDHNNIDHNDLASNAALTDRSSSSGHTFNLPQNDGSGVIFEHVAPWSESSGSASTSSRAPSSRAPSSGDLSSAAPSSRASPELLGEKARTAPEYLEDWPCIVKEDGVYYEVRCPECGANAGHCARLNGALRHFRGCNGMATHMRLMHRDKYQKPDWKTAFKVGAHPLPADQVVALEEALRTGDVSRFHVDLVWVPKTARSKS
ncbi:hypothetical protein P152DRAFT_473664 [Eremomyces bilateralis CBS 781.70]|uniref:Uncharacterized protein n=1 Tax=Eremomyces bilateralis CBS 781.70 TaxID=1392243 RepID=A0A6G1G3V2_9PEZI|nr:uncharacterized protein P152DRAFT_473664 [Eremomyces bilateralis CBS 781.70]KAF1812499.1 hypothetical protein P152DRAFT_473664 [Eremomyces bilateralis CBS 781.70]